jgi:hypothetical protein
LIHKKGRNMGRYTDRRLQVLERRLMTTKRAEASSAALSQMSTDDLRGLRSLLVSREQQPGYLPTETEQAALERWQDNPSL